MYYEKESGVIFESEAHMVAYRNCLKRYPHYLYSDDTERGSLFYLITATEDCRYHIDDIFDFKTGYPKKTAVMHPWATGTDKQCIRLGFNLYSDRVLTASAKLDVSPDSEEDPEALQAAYEGEERFYSLPCEVFCGEFFPILLEGLKIRFEMKHVPLWTLKDPDNAICKIAGQDPVRYAKEDEKFDPTGNICWTDDTDGRAYWYEVHFEDAIAWTGKSHVSGGKRT